MTRAIRERPRLAALTGAGLVVLVAIGLGAGLLLDGGGESSGADARRSAAERAATRQAQELRAVRAELAATDARLRRLERQASEQRVRAESWKRRAQRRARELRRARARARE